MKQDRFLIAILVAVCILVIAALGLFFSRQDTGEYGSDDAPEGVVRNYVIAIHNEDFEKAYGYLQDSPTKPDYQEFRQSFLGARLDTSNVSVKITDTKISSDEAVVKLILTHGSVHPFQGSWSEKENALLVPQDGNWKLTEMPYPYWGWDWYQ
jgi:hypothetical protein